MAVTSAVDVAIIGGGPVGLTCSILLAKRGISHALFERYPDTSIHPKACGINQRTVEIFRVMGIEEEVYKHAAPPEIAGRTAWYTSSGPEGREIVSRDAWGGGQYKAEYEKHSACRYCILPQIRLEPILKRRALHFNSSGIHYSSEVTAIDQGRDGATLTVRGNGLDRKVGARFVLAADGGRTATDTLNVPWLGEANIFNMVSAHFRSPLRSLHPDPRNFMTWFSNPAMGGSAKTGYLYQIGPWPLERNNEEWVFACALTPLDPDRYNEETMVDRLHKTLKMPDLPVEILSLSHWNVNAIYAERYRLGRVFLVGDAAHKIPPWGALGMNTGIQDAQNLVWKLELALQDEQKYDSLLDTYHIERRPIGKQVGEWSLHNLLSHAGVMDVAMGLSNDKSVEENERNIAPLFDSSHQDHAAKRAAIDKAQKILDTEFKAPGVEVGWFYPSADRQDEGGQLRDGQLLPDGSLNYEFYIPTTVPGHFVPHAWLQKDGEKRAIFDLVPLNRLVLFVQEHGWEKLGDERVQYELIGDKGWTDVDGTWAEHCGVSKSGGVLVRPDGIVAWRGEKQWDSPEKWTTHIDELLCCIFAS